MRVTDQHFPAQHTKYIARVRGDRRQAPGVQRVSQDAARQAQGAHVHHPSLPNASSYPSHPKMLPQSISACLVCFTPLLKTPLVPPGVLTRMGQKWRGVPRFNPQPCSPTSKTRL